MNICAFEMKMKLYYRILVVSLEHFSGVSRADLKIFVDEWVRIIRLVLVFMFILHSKMRYASAARQKWKLMIDRRLLG